MELDLRQITEQLITELLTESENLKQQAEGARKLFVRIAKESEKLDGLEHSIPGTETPGKE